MATIPLYWNNTLLISNSNVLDQTVFWREKAVGGSFNTTFITPSNNVNKNVASADFTNATPNKVYEFRVQSNCTTGGPVLNNNGIVEEIVFECIAPTLFSQPSGTAIDVSLNVANTSITKARIVLKKQLDDSTVETQTVSAVVGNITTQFNTGITVDTAYYVTVELYANVNGFEVVSSATEYLNAVCGGNVLGYQITTILPMVSGAIYNALDLCSGTYFGRIVNVEFNGAPITLANGNTMPVYPGQTISATIPAGVGTLEIFTDGDAGNISFNDNTVSGTFICQGYAGAGSYIFTGVDITNTPGWGIQLSCDLC